MKHSRVTTILAFLTMIGAGSAHAQASMFRMTFDEFRKALDGTIRLDTIDSAAPDANTTTGCRKVKDTYQCAFHDAGFQHTVEGFRKLGMVNGRFSLKMRLQVDTVQGKVSKVTLFGDRSDPANLFGFIGTVVNVMQVSDPGAGKGEGEMTKISDRLGLMRGDDAPDIGKPRKAVLPYAAINCIERNSHVSMAMECDFIQNPG